jgi:hypothetical protein
MLEEHVVFECNTSQAHKHWGAHEVIWVGAKAINDIMVIPEQD